MEPAFRLDMLSADELAGQGVSLYPVATPPSVNQGLVLNGVNQYARARNNIILPSQFTIFVEFMPTFNWDLNGQKAFCDGDAAGTRIILFKNNNASGNLLSYIAGTYGATVASADYSALWRLNLRNRIAIASANTACAYYMNGVALVETNFAGAGPAHMNYFTLGADYTGASNFAGTIYDFQIYPRLLTAAEAIQLTTVT